MEVHNQPSTSSGAVVDTSCPTATASTGNIVDSMLAEILASDPNIDWLRCMVLLNNYIKEKQSNMHEDSPLWWKNNPKISELYGAVRQYLSKK